MLAEGEKCITVGMYRAVLCTALNSAPEYLNEYELGCQIDAVPQDSMCRAGLECAKLGYDDLRPYGCVSDFCCVNPDAKQAVRLETLVKPLGAQCDPLTPYSCSYNDYDGADAFVCSRAGVTAKQVSGPNDLVAAFARTGCPNPNVEVPALWESWDSTKVLSDMNAVCQANLEGVASSAERELCCGTKAAPCVTACTLVSSLVDQTKACVDNCALNKVVTCNETIQQCNNPNTIVDGNSSTTQQGEAPCYESSSCTDASWVQVDLGSLLEINTVTFVTNHKVSARFCGLKVEVSTDGTKWRTVSDLGDVFGAVATENGYTVEFPKQKARYVRQWAARSSSEDKVSFMELQVRLKEVNDFGCLDRACCSDPGRPVNLPRYSRLCFQNNEAIDDLCSGDMVCATMSLHLKKDANGDVLKPPEPIGCTGEYCCDFEYLASKPIIEEEASRLSGGEIAGIVIGSLAFVAIVVGAVVLISKQKSK